MRKRIGLIVALAALAVPSAAFANAGTLGTVTVPGQPNTTLIGTTQGKVGKNTTTQYKAAYNSPYGQDWACSGVRQVSKVVDDSFTCSVSDIVSLSAWAPLSTNYNLGWNSDFDGQAAVSDTITVTDNLNGTATVSGVAYYIS